MLSRLLFLLPLIMMAFSLEGCTPLSIPNDTELCATSAPTPGWNSTDPKSALASLDRWEYGGQMLDIAGINRLQHEGRVLDTYQLSIIEEQDVEANSEAKGTFWVLLHGSEQGSPSQIQPMLYQPVDAWVEINGVRTAASGMVQYYPVPGDRNRPQIVKLPFDFVSLYPINPASKAQRITGGGGTVYIEFPVKRPSEPHDHWTVHLGTIKLGDNVLQIPDRKSCFIPSHMTIVPLGLAS
jgi:hypothetical protein